MALWHRLRALRATDRRLLAETGVMLLLARIGLWVLPFSTLRQVLDGTRVSPREPRPEFPGRVAWAVAAVSRRLPAMTCLVQSLAAHALLHRQGHRAALHIGVQGRGTGAAALLDAHAWVECEGRVVAGEVDNLVDYRKLRPVGPPASSATPGPS